MSGTVSAHDPTRMPEQLAEMIGQLQHVVDLLELAIGLNTYDPVVVDLAGLTAAAPAIVQLPAGACEIVQAHFSSNGAAATFKIFRAAGPGGDANGPNGKLIGQMFVPAGTAAADLILHAPIPTDGCTLQISTSATITQGAITFVLRPVRLGGYPYAS